MDNEFDEIVDRIRKETAQEILDAVYNKQVNFVDYIKEIING